MQSVYLQHYLAGVWLQNLQVSCFAKCYYSKLKSIKKTQEFYFIETLLSFDRRKLYLW